jgi:alpha-glucosidase
MRRFAIVAALSALFLPSTAAAQTWWKDAVVYEIYPRSFQDTNGDGVGDLNGITQRLDYIAALGVDAIWLTPVYPSPQVDFGYDISDYKAIDPQYGTLKDFDRLVAEAKKRHIRIIMDLVLNHTSDKHAWFEESKSSRSSAKRNWYIWRDGKGPGLPPNNWESLFGHSAWRNDARTGQWYYHKFYAQQPDLNWRNPDVRAAMYDVEKFWIERGVEGFRLDAITTLFEDPKLHSENVVNGSDGKPEINAFGDIKLDNSRTDNLPEVHDVLKDLHRVAAGYKGRNVVIIGETYLNSIADLKRMYGADDNEIDLPMDTQVGVVGKFDATEMRARIEEAEALPREDQPLFVFDNHDNPRLDRFGDGVHNTEIAKVIAAVLFASRDTALFYYGDEIGMATTPPARKEDVRDPIGIIGWPKEKGRDGERTPMQWTAAPNAGFTKPGVQTWLPIPASAASANVAAELQNPQSTLIWYKRLIALKHRDAALHSGSETILDRTNPHVLSWLRQAGDEKVVVACNFTAEPQHVSLDLGTRASVEALLASPGAAAPHSLRDFTLPAFGVVIARLRQATDADRM